MTVSSWKWHKGHIRFDQGSLGEIKLMVNFFLDDLKIWTAWKSSNVFIWSTSNLVLYPQLIFLYWDTVKKPPPSQISFVSAVRHSMFFFICIEFNIKKGNKMDYLLISTHLIGFRTSTLLKCSKSIISFTVNDNVWQIRSWLSIPLSIKKFNILYIFLTMNNGEFHYNFPSHLYFMAMIKMSLSWNWMTIRLLQIIWNLSVVTCIQCQYWNSYKHQIIAE